MIASKKINRENLLYIVVVLIILISIFVPTIIWFRDFFSGFDNKIDSEKLSDYATFQTFIISFWGLLLNSILVLIAYMAFKNFGVKEQFHNKQLTLVAELATEISSTVLSNMMYHTFTAPNGEDHQIVTGFTLSFFEISLMFDYNKFSLMCVRSNNIENTFPFLKYRNNPVLPTSIAKQLNKLYRPLQYSLSIQKDELPKNYVFLFSKHVDKDDYSKDWIYKYYDNPADFKADCLSLRTAIIEWLKEYGAKDINI
jgi:hypothetical protein